MSFQECALCGEDAGDDGRTKEGRLYCARCYKERFEGGSNSQSTVPPEEPTLGPISPSLSFQPENFDSPTPFRALDSDFSWRLDPENPEVCIDDSEFQGIRVSDGLPQLTRDSSNRFPSASHADSPASFSALLSERLRRLYPLATESQISRVCIGRMLCRDSGDRFQGEPTEFEVMMAGTELQRIIRDSIVLSLDSVQAQYPNPFPENPSELFPGQSDYLRSSEEASQTSVTAGRIDEHMEELRNRMKRIRERFPEPPSRKERILRWLKWNVLRHFKIG